MENNPKPEIYRQIYRQIGPQTTTGTGGGPEFRLMRFRREDADTQVTIGLPLDFDTAAQPTEAPLAAETDPQRLAEMYPDIPPEYRAGQAYSDWVEHLAVQGARASEPVQVTTQTVAGLFCSRCDNQIRRPVIVRLGKRGAALVCSDCVKTGETFIRPDDNPGLMRAIMNEVRNTLERMLMRGLVW